MARIKKSVFGFLAGHCHKSKSDSDKFLGKFDMVVLTFWGFLIGKVHSRKVNKLYPLIYACLW